MGASDLAGQQMCIWKGNLREFDKLDLGDHYIHNYIITSHENPLSTNVYIGETSNRKIRINQSLQRFRGPSPNILCLYSPIEISQKSWRTYIEGRLYFALRRHPSASLLNDPRMVSVVQNSLKPDFLSFAERGIHLALKHLVDWKLETPTHFMRPKPLCHLNFEMSLCHNGRLYFADAFEENNRWVVRAGSYVRHSSEGPFDDVRHLREELIDNGALYPEPSGLYRFGRDVAFSHPNAAAGVVNGKMACGAERWVVRGKGTPLKDFALRFPGRRGCAASFDIRTS
jgi:hypothetical protein